MRYTVKAPWWFWAILTVLVLWAIIGAYFYWIDRTLPDADYAKLYGPDLLEMHHRVPLWATASYAVGVWGGVLGCLALLFKQKWAVPIYKLSFMGALLAWGWNIMDETGRANLADGGWVMLVIVLALCLFQIWFAKKMTAKGIIA